ncbi:MAG: hypothetical protein GY913_04495 [Proteobacteria bacterium]|nr:hypothetical protein [Pseudomonadota bacterium]
MLFFLACATTPTPSPPEVAPPVVHPIDDRQRAVELELAQGRVTPVVTDLSAFTAEEQAMVAHLQVAAQAIERLYLKQRGAFGMQPPDQVSQQLFDRNQGPWCDSTATADDPACSAVDGAPPYIVGIYPESLQSDGFCVDLEARNADVMDPFHVARLEGDELVAVPYTEAWPQDMAAAADALNAAADALEGTDETALQAYLRAAAKAFGDNDWFAADAAWAEMNQRNSAWYLRVGPDETYWEPCSRHAGFHMVLARVNSDGLVWQDALSPVKQDMEAAIAELAGPQYAERTVGFELPEFIDIVLNAGDARSSRGATVGQSLPNWGPVADAGGRTVAMTNLFNDPLTLEAQRRTMESLFCPATMPLWSPDREAFLVTTVLHEAAHNLGPTSGHRVDGQSDEERFGGPLASMLEELKAQTAALYYTETLSETGVLAEEMVVPMHMADIAWALKKVGEGMSTPEGNSKAYPRLAAIQIGWLLDFGALSWDDTTLAANGQDAGCFELHAEKLSPAIHSMAAEVFRVKGDMNVESAQGLEAGYVLDPPPWHAVVAERTNREPQPSFTYELVEAADTVEP